MAGKFQLNWIRPNSKAKQDLPSKAEVLAGLQPGTKVEITFGFLKGERATIEVSPETGSHIQECETWTEVWIRYEKGGEKVGRAILTPVWQDISELRVVE